MANSGRRFYVQQAREHPVLSKEDEAVLAERVRSAPPGDPVAHKLVLSNMAFVIKVASEYRNMGVPFDDLVNEGNLGVLEAARHFDAARGTRFLTYAVWWIRKAMLRAVARQGALVQVPAYQLKKLRAVVDAEGRLSKELGRGADREEISREMQVARTSIDAILQLRSRQLSLDEPVGDSDTPYVAGLADERSINPEDALLANENEDLVHWALGALDEEERTVIVNRFGLDGNDASTLQELGVRLGVSRERVRQIEVRAKKRLRRAIASQRHPYAGPRGVRRQARPAAAPA